MNKPTYYAQDFEQVKEFVLPALVGLSCRVGLDAEKIAEEAVNIGVRTFQELSERGVDKAKTA